MHLFTNLKEKQLTTQIIGIFFLFYVLLLSIGGFVVYQVAINQTQSLLQKTAERVKEDLVYKNGTWKTQRYTADPNLPGTYPLYVIDTNGFVLDRWKPIHGFLDTSDAKHVLSYQKPQTITTPTNQHWRILSTPIEKNGETVGVVTTAHYIPLSTNSTELDTKLTDANKHILTKTVYNKNELSVKNLDARDVEYDIAFQVVDRFNKIIAKSNNTNSIDQIPNYLDISYLGQLLQAPSTQIIKDETTGEPFYLITTPLYDTNHSVSGILVAGHSIAYIYEILKRFIIAMSSIGLCLFMLLSLILLQMIQKALLRFGIHLPSTKISRISFNKKKGTITIDNEEITIPYATNQYYLCEALFSSPKKRWEIDELLERFGEVEMTNWRKVYDTMNTINKKLTPYLNTKLILAKEKTYQLNPDLLPKLTPSN